ncbi:SH3 domain-containing protein [Roseivivax marinus]|uniref:SH3 domain-containing protein n=1 Tax=Roseivivax marinus TaxID=1379903 RepID=UPI001F034277|nr:SH3 domain-containing protein [Roseivivax marinus]UMA63902.1 SH3 domain-containing protein [Roseivivax marinus]
MRDAYFGKHFGYAKGWESSKQDVAGPLKAGGRANEVTTMYKFILVTFGVLFLAFYEMSGGSDFEPGWWLDKNADAVAEADAAEAQSEQVARADSGGVLTQVVASAEASEATPAQKAPAQASDTPEPIAVSLNSGSAGSDDPLADVPLTRRTTDTEVETGVSVRETTASSSNAEESSADMRVVDGNVVNMRTGPGTNFSVIAQLRRGDEVQVLRSNDGWVKLRTVENNRIGWMADYLVTASR